MLVELKIKNYALIKDLTLELGEKFNIFTGETGAGKSIIIGALQAILGEGKLKEKTQLEKIYLEAIFKVNNKQLLNLLREENFLDEAEKLLILSREYLPQKGNLYRINGKITNLNFIKQITEELVDILGQQSSQSLTKSKVQMDLLDSFCGKKVLNLREQVGIVYKNLKEIENKINYLLQQEKEIRQKLDLYNFQIKEIESANLSDENEEEILSENLKTLRNLEKINSSLNKVAFLVEEEPGLDNLLSEIIKELSKVADLNSNLEQIYNNFLNIKENLIESRRELTGFLEGLNFNEKNYEEYENRLYLIKNLKKKYGANIKEILNYYEKILKEIKLISNPDEHLKELNQEKEKILIELKTLSEKLSLLRKKGAEKLSQKIKTELEFLHMPKCKFEISVDEKKDEKGYIFSFSGINKIEFLFSANIGIPLMPLAKIISGGELSRVALAIKTVLNEVDERETLIFDEVDSGLGGEAAIQVAKKLTELSKNHQVISITHLPSIACFADTHYWVIKKSTAKQTFIQVENLQNNEREKELARMLRGKEISQTVMQNAKELIQFAKKEKLKIGN